MKKLIMNERAMVNVVENIAATVQDVSVKVVEKKDNVAVRELENIASAVQDVAVKVVEKSGKVSNKAKIKESEGFEVRKVDEVKRLPSFPSPFAATKDASTALSSSTAAAGCPTLDDKIQSEGDCSLEVSCTLPGHQGHSKNQCFTMEKSESVIELHRVPDKRTEEKSKNVASTITDHRGHSKSQDFNVKKRANEIELQKLLVKRSKGNVNNVVAQVTKRPEKVKVKVEEVAEVTKVIGRRDVYGSLKRGRSESNTMDDVSFVIDRRGSGRDQVHDQHIGDGDNSDHYGQESSLPTSPRVIKFTDLEGLESDSETEFQAPVSAPKYKKLKGAARKQFKRL